MNKQRKSPAQTAGTSPKSSKKKAPAASAGQARPPGQEKPVSLHPILKAMRAELPKARHAQAEAFLNAFYERMGEDELPEHTPEGWAALAAVFLDFIGSREPGTGLVRLFNPTRKTHGWESPHTVLQVANDDMPFLVDSVTMALSELGIGVHVLGHPVLRVSRDKAGKLQGIGSGGAESLMHLEIDRQAPEAMPRIEEAVRAQPGFAASGLAILHAGSMEEAVALARGAARPGDVVSLSPASASFDAYPNFEARGRHFKQIVNAL